MTLPIAARPAAVFVAALLALACPCAGAAAPDAAILAAAQAQQPALIESLKALGASYHARDEYVEIDSIVPRLYLMVRLPQTAAHAN